MVYWPQHLRPHCYQAGTVEGVVDDEVLVRFEEIVVQVPADWLAPADDQ